MSGETPITWAFAHESRDAAGIAKRFRQSGADTIFYNFVTVDWQAVTTWRFAWRDEALTRYVEFCRSYLEPVARTDRIDELNGGFVIFRVLSDARVPAPPRLWFAPGTEYVYGEGYQALMAGRAREALSEFEQVHTRMPQVGTAANKVGLVRSDLRDFDGALAVMGPYIREGMVDGINLTAYATAAMGAGRFAEAERVLLAAVPVYTSRREALLIEAAFCRARMAALELQRGSPRQGREHLARLDGMMREMTEPEAPGLRNRFHQLRAFTQAMGLELGAMESSSNRR